MLYSEIRNSFIVALLGCLVLTGCSRSESTAGAARGDARAGLPVKEVRLAVAQERSLASRVSAPGTLAADEQATVSFKVPGRLSSLRVDLGSRVAKGQEVALLETEDFRVRVEQSNAALQQARARLGLPPQGEDDRIDINKSALVTQAAAVLDESRANRERTIRLVREGVLPQAELDRTSRCSRWLKAAIRTRLKRFGIDRQCCFNDVPSWQSPDSSSPKRAFMHHSMEPCASGGLQWANI